MWGGCRQVWGIHFSQGCILGWRHRSYLLLPNTTANWWPGRGRLAEGLGARARRTHVPVSVGQSSSGRTCINNTLHWHVQKHKGAPALTAFHEVQVFARAFCICKLFNFAGRPSATRCAMYWAIAVSYSVPTPNNQSIQTKNECSCDACNAHAQCTVKYGVAT